MFPQLEAPNSAIEFVPVGVSAKWPASKEKRDSSYSSQSPMTYSKKQQITWTWSRLENTKQVISVCTKQNKKKRKKKHTKAVSQHVNHMGSVNEYLYSLDSCSCCMLKLSNSYFPCFNRSHSKAESGFSTWTASIPHQTLSRSVEKFVRKLIKPTDLVTPNQSKGYWKW